MSEETKFLSCPNPGAHYTIHMKPPTQIHPFIDSYKIPHSVYIRWHTHREMYTGTVITQSQAATWSNTLKDTLETQVSLCMYSYSKAPHTSISHPHAYLLSQNIFKGTERCVCRFSLGYGIKTIESKSQGSCGIIIHFIHPNIHKCVGNLSRRSIIIYLLTNTPAYCTQKQFSHTSKLIYINADTTHKAFTHVHTQN